ncbi:DUF4262 domain-containing protein [Roseibium sp. RKSG952]|uniref:DUF4262 domain-containing protein n=1 Tax=Roseibium sp. RKSG952 TaxID=2529384 RepID=UPI0018AD157A|nr:DUF4262 domain-containing protein [Roseibium sp. RKSG952]
MVLDKTREHIRKYGWSVIGVFPDQDGGEPGFSYSVGFTHTLKHPEIFVVGLNQQTAQVLLNDLGNRIRKGERFDEPVMVDKLLREYSAAIRPITDETAREYSNVGRAALRGVKFEACQLFYPDQVGRFPWDHDCDPRIAEAQTALFEYVGEPPTGFIPGGRPGH